MRMPSVNHVTKPPAAPARFVPPFENGDCIDRKTFHALYEKTPEGFKAELIGGVVHMVSPVTLQHSLPHARIIHWLCTYSGETPRTDVLDNNTYLLKRDGEVQPDAVMILQPKAGGLCSIDGNGYLSGPVELVVEIANSSASVDRHAKHLDYQRAGVREYLIVLPRTVQIEWHSRGKRGFAAIAPDIDDIVRSRVFPGLWLDPNGIFARSSKRLLEVLNEGLATEENAKFVAKLQKAAGRKAKP